MARKSTAKSNGKNNGNNNGPSVLARLGVLGLEGIEPAILAALIQEEPLLLIGPHGTGKSYLLNRLAGALGLAHRHYNASLLNFDDLVGYPLPDADGGLRYVQTPSSIWGAQAVFFDEISRCRPDMQNKLFPIIHERRVQGVALEGLLYRWSAMNPPARDGEESEYAGSEPLDTALADRFAFIVEVPDWQGFSPDVQEAVVLNADAPLAAEAGPALKALLASGRAYAKAVRHSFSPRLAAYTRLVCAILRQAGIVLSARRAGMLLRNIAGVHGAREAVWPGGGLSDSALLALTHSLPQRATGQPCDRLKILAAHKEAWKAAEVENDGPMHLLICEPDPLRRALYGIRAKSLRKADFSTVISDALATLPPGSRHALAVEVFETDASARLVAAVAEQCADLYAVVATPQDVHETVGAGSTRHRTWQHIVAHLAKLKPSDPDTPLVSNLLPGLFAKGAIASEAEADRVLDAWRAARTALQGGLR